MSAEGGDHSKIFQAARDQHIHFREGLNETRRVYGPASSEECPYPGLAPFGPEDARWYFGREALVAELLAEVDDRQRRPELIAVVAPSGAGKSSLLRAGLLPALTRGALPGSQHWAVSIFTPTNEPVRSLIRVIASLCGMSEQAVGSALAADDGSLADLVTAAGASVVIVVDQLEELFTLCDDEGERDRFIELLGLLAEQQNVVTVVLGLRSDFYSSCLSLPLLRSVLRSRQIPVGPMSRDELRQAIRHPAQDVGLDVEPGLVELLLADLGADDARYEAGRLPLLAHALRVTWQQRHGHVLTVNGYRDTGGIERAVALSADRIYNGLGADDERDIARAVFLRLVSVSDGGSNTRRRVSRADFPSDDGHASVLSAFTNHRILSQDRDTIEITHEALLRAWPRLVNWITENRTALLVGQQLSEAAQMWDRSDGDPSMLFRGTQLALARELTEQIHIGATAKEFLEASTFQERTEQLATKRRTRRLRVLAAALSILLFITTFATAAAVRQREQAIKNRDVAISRGLAALSQNASRPEHAMLLAAAAFQKADTTEARSALASASTQPYAGEVIVPQVQPVALGFSDDSRELIVGGILRRGPEVRAAQAMSTLTRWRLDDLRSPATMLSLPGWITVSIARSPDGVRIAVLEVNSTVARVSVRDPKTLEVLTTLNLGASPKDGWFHPPTFSRDGKTLYTATRDNPTVTAWDVNSGKVRTRISLGREPATRIAVSATGQYVAVSDAGGKISFWDPGTGKPLGAVAPSWGEVQALQFSPDSRYLLTAHHPDGIETISALAIWDMSKKLPIWTINDAGGLISNLEFSSDGSHFITTGPNSSITIRDITSGVEITRILTDASQAATASPDQKMIASAGDDGQLRLWDTSRSALALPSAISLSAISVDRLGNIFVGGSGETVWSVNWSTRTKIAAVYPDKKPLDIKKTYINSSGNIVAFGSDREFFVVDTGERRVLHHFKMSRPYLMQRDADISPDGTRLAIALGQESRDIPKESVGEIVSNRVELRDLGTGQATRWPYKLPGTPMSIRYSPNGQQLAIGYHGFIEVWRLSGNGIPDRLLSRLWPGEGSSPVVSLEFSPDGRLLASGGRDRNARLWDLRRSRQIAVFGGHSDMVQALAFSPSGRTLATSGFEPTIFLWDTKSYEPRGVLHSPDATSYVQRKAPITSLAFSPDQRMVYGGNTSGVLRAWPLDPVAAMGLICSVFHRKNLSKPTELPADARPERVCPGD